MNATIPTRSTPLRARADEAIATPINFIAFLVSLYLIDSRNRAQRESKASGNNRRTWLQGLLYRQSSSPYDWVDSYRGRPSPQSAYATTARLHEARVGDEDAAPARSTRETGGRAWFYHTKQTKLFRVEAADAFALRNSVLLALGVLAVSVGWVLWRTTMWLAARVLNRIVLARV
ncbi:hypothetical protein F4824DRAFT_120330 [Ustulina deusta]|nr:hypothetical protein F4824DRAFT_120330 [Ustulina deusta]